MADAQNNIFVSAGYCQEEIVSARTLCVNLPLHTRRCTRLLLHWDPLIDDIQRTHVSRWLVEVVQDAYTRADLEYDDDIRAHELRAIASSWAYVNQVRLEDILAAASWRSSGVFQGSYLRDMSSIVDGMATLGPIVAAQHVVCTRRQ